MSLIDVERQNRIVTLVRKAREHARREEYALALDRYLEAWELVPEPREAWDTSTHILAGVGDVLRARGDLARAMEVLLAAQGRTARFALREAIAGY